MQQLTVSVWESSLDGLVVLYDGFDFRLYHHGQVCISLLPEKEKSWDAVD
jgi:hypothetical protein